MRQVILDTETTGFKPEEGHRIVEFAALEMVDRVLTGKVCHIYINPERTIGEEVIKIHGITNEKVKHEKTFSGVAQQIKEFMQDSELIIHNAKFDLSFLNFQFKQLGDEVNFPNVANYTIATIDTLQLAKQKFPNSKNSLDALCDRFNINRTHRSYHGALIDCHLLAQVYLHLTKEQYQLIHEPKAKNKHSNTSPVFEEISVDMSKSKVYKASEEQREQHKKYLEILNKASHGSSDWYNNEQNK